MKMKNITRVLWALGLMAANVAALGAPAMAQTAFGDPPSRGGTGTTSGGDLVPVQAAIDGGTISVGATSQVVVLFRNDSGRPLQTGAIQLYPSSTVSASTALNNCNQEELAAGAVCAVSVSVKGLQAGSWRVEMLMRHSGRARLVTTTLSGSVTAADTTEKEFISDIEAIPNELDFGDLESAQSVVRGVVLRNITSEPIDINAIYIEAAAQSGYSLRTDCSRLNPGQACIVTVTWSPVLEGQASGVLLVEHNGPTSVASVKLEGEFKPLETQQAKAFPRAVPGKGLLVASQEKVDFGSGVATTSAITVSLVNIGDAPLTISDVALANGDNGVSISKKGCGAKTVLEPVEACPLTLTWSPVREGAVLDDVQVTHNGTRGVLVLPVRGTSTAIISQDTKAVRISGATATATIGSGDSLGAQGETVIVRDSSVDPASVLDGFVVTSHSPKRSIISGPGGSRIVYDGEEVVIGGFLWNVYIRGSGVEFRSGEDKVLLLFDRSLSSVNRVTGQSGSGGSSSTSSSASSATATGSN
ncbi:MAG TPA: choice-of-anchor D domain-containing protein [Micavibrio sp.]